MFDNYDKFDIWEAEQERQLEKYHICKCCDERIVDEVFYEIDGEPYCQKCAIEYYKEKHLNDYFHPEADVDEELEERASKDIEYMEVLYDF